MIDRKQQLRDVQHIINAHCFNGAELRIAGGAARDLAHGHEPSDIDIVATGVQVPELQALVDELATIGYCLDAWSDNRSPSNNDAGQHYTGHDLMRWTDVIQLSCVEHKASVTRGGTIVAKKRMDIDILVSPKASVRAAVLGNDFNLNMYELVGAPCVMQPVYVGDCPEKYLVQNRTSSITPERIERMRNLAIQYGWTV